ncbi:hypothetical protein [Tahibacter amnicola]|uniref:Uncharacterized protein n=1 Tax=Tahibacter amnicola TaxID=2976241 RepID=A0ABY6BKK4_9GAMM|nr:hypothetical protein [Tahibacter amnicola]UXI70299.1 hypothetical protein N4264_11880 [Tahibacter amnicola]
MSHSHDDDQADTSPEYGIQDVLVAVLAEDHHDFPRILHAARHIRDTTLASLRTVAQLLRAAAHGDNPRRSDLMHDAGYVVAQLTDFVDAVTTLESHAEFQRQRLAR